MKEAPTQSGLRQNNPPRDYGMGPRVKPEDDGREMVPTSNPEQANSANGSRLATAAGMTVERLRHFHLMRVTAWAEGRWRECRHGKCRKAKKCRGGARGTFFRFGYPDCYTLAEAARFGGNPSANETDASRDGSSGQARG